MRHNSYFNKLQIHFAAIFGSIKAHQLDPFHKKILCVSDKPCTQEQGMGGHHQKGTAEGLGHRGCCMCRSGDTGHQENISPCFPC